MRHVSMPAGLILALASTFSATGQQPPATQPSTQAGLGQAIRVLHPGASPRQTLRLTPRQGATGVIDLTMRIAARQIVDGAQTPEPPSPGVFMSFATVVTAIEGDQIYYTFECVGADLVGDSTIPPAIIDIMRGGIKMVVGLRGTGVISDRALNVRATVTREPGMDEALLSHAIAIERLLDQVNTPMPVEPVGVGGSWEIASTFDMDGLIVQETIICTLAAADGDTAEIEMEIRRHAGPQPVRDPNMPAGASADLSSYAFAGTGRSVLGVGRLHPVDGAINVTSESTVQMEFGGVRHEVAQHVTIKTELASKRGQSLNSE